MNDGVAMWLVYEIVGEFYMAGERVPPGFYKHVDSPYTLKLDSEDTLPARLDGRATCYVRIAPWRDAGHTEERVKEGLGNLDTAKAQFGVVHSQLIDTSNKQGCV